MGESPNARFWFYLPHWYTIFGIFERPRAKQKRAKLINKNIAVTGSNGKTTTTSLLHQILQREMVALKSHRNDGRGVFRTCIYFDESADCLVQEIGGGVPGGIRRIAKHFDYDGAIITSVGTDHWSLFSNSPEGSRELISKNKAQLAHAVKEGGFVCLNQDDEFVRSMHVPKGVRKVTFGQSDDADVRAENFEFQGDGTFSFDVLADGSCARVRSPFFGMVMIPNILAAIAAAIQMGVSFDVAAETMNAASAVSERQTRHEGKITGHQYFVDSNKAPVWSTEKLIDDLKNLKQQNPIFVLGQTSGRSPSTPEDTQKLLLKARDNGATIIGTSNAAISARKLLERGEAGILAAETPKEVFEILKSFQPSLVVLKGSMHSKLDRIVLMEEAEVHCQKSRCSLKQLCINCDQLAVPNEPSSPLAEW